MYENVVMVQVAALLPTMLQCVPAAALACIMQNFTMRRRVQPDDCLGRCLLPTCTHRHVNVCQTLQTGFGVLICEQQW
jgi:hypothetical protein